MVVKQIMDHIFQDLGFITFFWAGFTAAQREKAQEDFKVPYEAFLRLFVQVTSHKRVEAQPLGKSRTGRGQ